jgi:hypothetical protein
MYKDNDLIDVKKLKEFFNLTARQWQNIKKDIPDLETKGTNTFYKSDERRITNHE